MEVSFRPPVSDGHFWCLVLHSSAKWFAAELDGFVTVLVTFANGWDARSMWIASAVSGPCCALVFIAFEIA